ncbi:MAG TPA: head GIN domain-containing protein [Anaerolineales bacterium]|nr:head GIN domain-containing protein [Anaerolineales bacterium]
MNRKVLFGMTALVLAALACQTLTSGMSQVVGSGHAASETRTVPAFDSVELAGSADVNIILADSPSVNVEADDNILPLVETVVNNGKLVIRTKPLTNIVPTNKIVVTIAMKSLKDLTLSGSGNINVGAMTGPELTVDVSGSGNVTVEGTVDNLTVDLSGSGNVNANNLKAKSAKVGVSGSGDVKVNVSDTLDASISGSGNIRYEGNPAQVNKSVTGSGTINP